MENFVSGPRAPEDNDSSRSSGLPIALASLILVILAFVATHAQARVVDVIECYNASKDHYFITSIKAEIDKLDTGEIKGWARTGKQFRAHETLVNGTNAVCRYHIPANQGDSHFFSAPAAECAKVRAKFPSFIRESGAVMHIAIPHHVTGKCADADQPVYRVWNQRLDSNHRYVTDKALRDQMVAQGWVAEGYGADAVTMCTPKSAAEPHPATASLPPPCKGTNSRVAAPGAPHGSHGNSPISANVGYVRFATGGGAEALLPGGIGDGGPCGAMWTAAGYTYDVWNQHEARIITAMGTQSTDKQIVASLAQAPGPNVYDASNKSAAVSVPLNVGFSFENLGTSGGAAAGSTPGPCNPQATLANLHWCRANTTYVGQVSLAMQPITATTNTRVATMDIGTLLDYALANNIQIFELYPEEWPSANSPTWPSFVPANQAKYQAALQAAAQTLGATNGQ